MREIKFRAWDKKKKKMFDWKYFLDWCDIDHLFGNLGIENKRTNIPDFEVMQYTGMKDRNGKEIYEGDIYHQGDKNILYVVEWLDTGLMGKQKGTNSYAGLSYWKDKIEVVGNIWDNPELLESVEA
jgi:uncharacterized phage protein (TIGR01671 family)